MKKKTLKSKVSADENEDGGEGKKKSGARGFDSSKDKVIKKISSLEGKMGSLTVQICSYDGGPKKVAVVRMGEKANGEPWFRSMGRLSQEEATWLYKKLKKAANYAD